MLEFSSTVLRAPSLYRLIELIQKSILNELDLARELMSKVGKVIILKLLFLIMQLGMVKNS